jgi:hypothetical protein
VPVSGKGDIGSCLGRHFLDGQENLKLLLMAEGGILQSKWPKVVPGTEITLSTSFLHDFRNFVTFFSIFEILKIKISWDM